MGAPVARLTYCAVRLNDYVDFVQLLEDLLERTAEARDDFAAIQRRLSLEDDLRLIVLMNGDGPGFRIDHPDDTHAASEILGHLRGDLSTPISRRSDFDCKIRWSRPEPIPIRV